MDLLFKREDVFSVLNAADAEEYLNTRGYFAESFSELEKNISEEITDTLRAVETDNVWCFTSDNDSFPLFLPVCKVNNPIRPFKNAQELIDIVLDGNPDNWVIMRHKADGHDKTNLNIWHRRIQEYSDELNQVIFGYQLNFSLEQLCRKWEWKDSSGTWRPFGVSEL